jgi:LysM repeat protein
MPIKNLTLGFGLILTCTAVARPAKYTVKSGDTISEIADRFHVHTKTLIAINGIDRNRPLKVGKAITIPAPDNLGGKTVTKGGSLRHHTVAEGENDWIIAHRAGITTVALKKVNPGVNLARLKPGQVVALPAGSLVARSLNRIHSRYAVVNGDSVNIRRHPSTSSPTITQVDSGTRVVVLDRNGDWYRLRFPRGTEGWIRSGLLKACSAPPREHHHRVEYASRHAHHHYAGLYRSRRHGSHTEINDYSYDPREAGDTGGKILERAKAMRGTRYRWGSMSRSATDCSGFTSQVFKSQGYTLPRTSSEQSHAGHPVKSKELKPGDLVFFHTMRGARVTHVGIYMGKGKFIHASSAGGHVQVNSLSEGYYQNRLVGARRVATGKKK